MLKSTLSKSSKRSLILAMLSVTAFAGLPAAAACAASPLSPKTLYQDGADGRYLLGGTWLFSRGGVDPAQASTGGWKRISVPYAWNANETSATSFVGGVAYYRRDFVLPSGAATAWLVRFESVNYFARVWLNGHEIGSHAGAYLPWELRLSGLRTGVNRLVVRTDNRRGVNDLPPTGFSTLSGQPIGGWWNYGGLLREVYLRRVEAVDLTTVAARPLLACASCPARIAYSTVVTNYSPAPQSVRVKANIGGKGVAIGSARVAPGGHVRLSRIQTIGRVHLWSLSDPYLYPVIIRPFAGGAPAEAYRLHVGVRSVRVVDGHLLLNDQPLNLRGVGITEDAPGVGFALSNAQRDAIMTSVQALGAHLIRSHYPLSPQLLEQADRDGVLVWAEIPVYSMKSSALGRSSTRHFAVNMLRNNIEANGNHPSIAVWSVANELAGRLGSAETTYFNAAANAAHMADPTRPVGAAINGYPSVTCQAGYGKLDVLGLNDYFGWYPGPDGSIADPDLLGTYLDQARACYPSKALLVTEFGAEANRDGPPEERGTYEFQSNFVSFHLGVFATRPYLSGADYWTLQEYKVRPSWNGGNPLPTPGGVLGQKGLMTYSGVPKPAFAVAQQIYKTTVQARPVGSPPNG